MKPLLLILLLLAGSFLISKPVFAVCGTSDGGQTSSCNYIPGCDSWSSGANWFGSCTNGSQSYKYCGSCSSEAEARQCACGGGAGLTTPSCTIGTFDNYGNPKTVFANGDRINIRLNAADTGEVYSGAQNSYQSFPTFSGRCSGAVGFCPSGNICASACTNVCSSANGGGDLRLTANNPSSSAGSCNISWTVSNSAGQSSCSYSVTVNPSTASPNLQVTAFSIPNGSPNQNVNASVTVRNVGNQATGANFRVGVRMRGGNSIACNFGGDFFLNTASLAAGASRNLTIPVVLPGQTGTFSAGAMVDFGCVITESNEGDNKRLANYTVSGACTPVTPSVSLVSPDNGVTLGSQRDVTLEWDSVYGNACPVSTNKNFVVLRDETDGVFVTLNETDGQDVGLSEDFTVNSLQCEHNYQWRVMVSNDAGATKVTSSSRTFRTADCSGASGNFYFTSFGGSVYSGSGNLDDRNIPNTIAVSNNQAGNPLSAGIVSGNPINELVGGGKFSMQGSDRGFNLSNYNTSGAERNKSRYESLLRNALSVGRFPSGDPSAACGSDEVNIYGKRVKYSCWSGGSISTAINNALANPQEVQVIVPNESTIPFSVIDLGMPAEPINGKNLFIFVPASVRVASNVRVAPDDDSTMILISSGDLNVDPSVTELDGAYVFEGDFFDGNGASKLTGLGQLYGVGEASKIAFERQVVVGESENFSFQGKYFSALWPMLSKPKVSWTELSPQ